MTISQLPLLIAELIAITIGLKYWRRLKLGYRVALVQVIIACIVEVTGRMLSVFHLGTNAWLFNIYALIETIIFLWMFGIFSGHPYTNKVLIVVAVIMPSGWFIAIATNGIFLFSNWYVIAESLLAIVLFILLLISKSVFSKSQLFTQPLFLLCIAIIIYYASVIPLFGVLNHLVEVDSKLAGNLFYINKIAASIRYALTGTALYLHGRNAVEDAHQ